MEFAETALADMDVGFERCSSFARSHGVVEPERNAGDQEEERKGELENRHGIADDGGD